MSRLLHGCCLLLLVPFAQAAAPRMEVTLAQSNSIILLEGDLLGPVSEVRQRVIQAEQPLIRDLHISFDAQGQIVRAEQQVGPNPLWQSLLQRDDWGGWISRSLVALQLGETLSLEQQVCVYKSDARGRITRATRVETGVGFIGITRYYYVYTPDGRVRFYLALGKSPGYGLYVYRSDGRLRQVIRHDSLTLATFTRAGHDLSSRTETAQVTDQMTCLSWNPRGNCSQMEKQEQIHASATNGQPQTVTTRYLLHQTIRYRTP